MRYATLNITIDAGVATVTIDRPAKLNALSAQVFADLLDALDALVDDPEVRAMLLTGAGERAFVAGADIGAMHAMTPAEGERFAALGQHVTRRLEALPFPVIACVDGHALGGGCELAMSCDFIYATARSGFGQPEVSLGLIPCFGGCVRLVHAVGPARARELIYTGRRVDAAEAQAMGLVNAVYPDRAAMLAAARRTVTQIAARSATAVALCKQAISGGLGAPLAEGLRLERVGFRAAMASPDGQEGVAAFVGKRAPAFGPRRDPAAPMGLREAG